MAEHLSRAVRVQRMAEEHVAKVIGRVVKDMAAPPLPQEKMRALFQQVETEEQMAQFVAEQGQEQWDRQAHLAYLDAARERRSSVEESG